MRSNLIIALLAACLVSACNKTGVPTEYQNACAQDLDGKTLEISGVLEPRSSVYCSNRGGRMECPFDVPETAGGEKKISADIEVCSGANTVSEIPKGFKKEDIKVRDNAGNQIALGSDKVKLTGKMLIAPAVTMAVARLTRSAIRPNSGPATPKARKAIIELIDNTVERFLASASRCSSASWGGPLSPCIE